MSLAWATLVVVAFGLTVAWLDLPERAREVARRSMESLDDLRDPALSDEAKGRVLRRQASRLFVLLGILAGGSVLALGFPLLLVWLFEQLGVASMEGTLAVLERVDFLVAVTALGAGGYLVVRRVDGS